MNDSENTLGSDSKSIVTLLVRALRLRCPACGNGKLFSQLNFDGRPVP